MLSVYQRQLDLLGEGAEIMAMGNLAKMVGSGFEGRDPLVGPSVRIGT